MAKNSRSSILLLFLLFFAPIRVLAALSLLPTIRRICETIPSTFVNLPEGGIRLGLIDGDKLIPESCILSKNGNKEKISQCEKEIQALQEFNSNSARLGNISLRLINAREKYIKPYVFTRAKEIAKTLTPTQLKVFNAHYNMLGAIDLQKQMHAMTNKVKLFGCGESAAKALSQTFDASVLANQPIKVQGVRLISDLDTHAFILIDSEAKDIVIKNDPQQVETYMRALSKGYICDPWNAGYFSSVKQNKNELYFKNWIGVEIFTFSLEFDCSQLPPIATDFIHHELARLGLKNLHNSNNDALEVSRKNVM